MMRLIGLILVLAFIGLCHGQGAPWTEEETKIIRAKVWRFLTKSNVVAKEHKKYNADLYPYLRQTQPSAKKVDELCLSSNTSRDYFLIVGSSTWFS